MITQKGEPYSCQEEKKTRFSFVLQNVFCHNYKAKPVANSFLRELGLNLKRQLILPM